jgi:tetratricopeptide (TPR) repeat protein
MFNDLGFFYEQNRQYEKSLKILVNVISKFPDRIVAYVNIGDTYWGMGERENAKEAYLKYIELMEKEGKEAKVPNRVLVRIK